MTRWELSSYPQFQLGAMGSEVIYLIWWDDIQKSLKIASFLVLIMIFHFPGVFRFQPFNLTLERASPFPWSLPPKKKNLSQNAFQKTCVCSFSFEILGCVMSQILGCLNSKFLHTFPRGFLLVRMFQVAYISEAEVWYEGRIQPRIFVESLYICQWLVDGFLLVKCWWLILKDLGFVTVSSKKSERENNQPEALLFNRVPWVLSRCHSSILIEWLDDEHTKAKTINLSEAVRVCSFFSVDQLSF